MKTRKYYILLAMICLSMISCEKDTNDKKELNIKIENAEQKSQGIATTYPPKVTFYPNPFSDIVFCYIDGADEAVLNISNEDGYKIVDYVGNSLGFDFSEESSGAYNCEVIIGNKIQRITLIKQ